MQRLLLLGLNHTTAPLAVRERLAFTAEQQRQAIEQLRRSFPESEAVLISTCNRVEMYIGRALHGHPRVEEMAEFLAAFHKIPRDTFQGHLYERSSRDAVAHLFSVATSLDSMVLGESQILGQVRQAYDLARECDATGAILNPLFQRAIAVGKEVQHTTSLGEGSLSVAGVAVGYARRIFDHFNDKTVLCIGAGKMAVMALRGFAALKPKALLVCNRDAEKASRLAAEFAGRGVPLTDLESHLIAADIVITSTGATEPIITRKQFEQILKARRYRPIFLIDIAVPRDIDPSVGELDHVYLYNLDDLQKAVTNTQTQRGGAVEQARSIIDRHVEEFMLWQQQRELGPAIDQLYKRFHEMAADEVARTLNKMPGASDAEKAHLEELARRIVNKLLHQPVKMLRDRDTLHGTSAQYLHAIERIFRMNEGSSADESHQRPGADAD
jgi:glutamyl-tRNA reductase